MRREMRINFVDLKKQYLSIKPEIDTATQQVIENAAFILGKELEEFEKEFAAFCQAKCAVGVDSGISALELGMRALGIGPGDEVIVPANSFIASASAVSFTGAKPVLVDCDPVTYNINPSLIERSITKNTRAIMPVHLYGQPADMELIREIARKNKLLVVEDACQAHGAEYHGKRVGSFGDFAAFSFYPGKNLGAYGDGGILVTNKKSLAEKVAMMRNYGQKKKYDHRFLAWNRRLDNLQAAVLRVKLKYLDEWNKKRRKKAGLYSKYLKGLPVELPQISVGVSHVFHLFVIRTQKRDALQKALEGKGVSTGIHYPIPIHLQRAYRDLGEHRGSFPVTERYAKEILSLPMYPELSEEEIKYVANQIRVFFS